jgi:hypothetical protein
MFGNGDQKYEISAPLQAYFVERGFESAMKMHQDESMVLYMRAEIEKLVVSASFLPDPSVVVRFWDRGFQRGVILRVNGWRTESEAREEFACRDSRVAGTLRVSNGRKA